MAMVGRSREGAWIEIHHSNLQRLHRRGRSREGAWIEIPICVSISNVLIVAPVRERGLKSCLLNSAVNSWLRRSREGAWIEIGIGLGFSCSTIGSLP